MGETIVNPEERGGEARPTTPASGRAVAAVVSGQHVAAVRLYRQLSASDDQNLFFSPYSITAALSMTYAGARGETARAFEAFLGSDLEAPEYHRAMSTLQAALASRGQNASGRDGQPFRLRSVNQLFAQDGFSLETPFLETMSREYGAAVRRLDFRRDPTASRLTINEWVAEQTENRIPSLIQQLPPSPRLILVNAMYFTAAWATQFSESETEDGSFFLLDGTSKQVPFMHHRALRVPGATLDGVEIVELPYDGGELSMVILMPPRNGFAAFEEGLTPDVLEHDLAALEREALSLRLPRFEVRSEERLTPALRQLGLGIAFSEDADFSGISQTEPLDISDVVHAAFISVDERGTEAAAVTATSFRSHASARPLTIDRPFVFLIRDRSTNAIVFMGRVTNP